MRELDLVAAAFVGHPSDDTPADTLDLDAPDAFVKFVDTAQLAGALGGRSGWARAENLASETADIDKRFSKLSPPPVKRATDSMAKSGDDLDAPLVDDDPQRLEKSGDRRKRSLALWMKGELAIGKSARELIDYAAVHDLETANLMREVAQELGAI